MSRIVKYPTLSLILFVFPIITHATVCGVIPESWERVLFVIILLTILLAFGSIISGFLKLIEVFIIEKENNSNHLFWWLLCATITLALVGYIVYLGAPKACGIGPHIDIPLINN